MEVIFGLDSVGIKQTSKESMWLGIEEEQGREREREREEKRSLKSDFSLERRREKVF